jgi:dihydroxy-acid dehydratase
MSENDKTGLRSTHWFGEQDLPGFLHRASLRVAGFSSAMVQGRPIVGVCNSWSEAVNCNLHFRGLAAAVKRGVAAAGGVPVEFPTISLGENLMKPTTMLYRNLMAMDVEESIHSNPFDAVVLIAGCDKTIPAQLMGAASADVPAIMLTGGPAEPAVHFGRELGVGTDLWRYTDDLRAGRITQSDYHDLEAAWIPTPGHCNEMGTASTMSCLVEALGMTLPGSASIPAVYARRAARAEEIGARAVEIAREGLRPSSILTDAAFANAITVLAALGGSTNAIVHLLALAGRVGVGLTLDRFDEIAARTPLLVDVRPAGASLLSDFDQAGGVPALLTALSPLLETDALTIAGTSLADFMAGAAAPDGRVIRTLEQPLKPVGGLAVVRGSLAPNGGVVKVSAASPALLQHRGPAVVFDGIEDVANRIDDPSLEVTPDSVLVLRNAGPIGAPGMPEWGMIPIPQRLLQAGVTDMVRVSDARMSGTGFGTCVLHVAPESAVGGPLAAVRDGDPIVLDVESRRLDLDVPAEELARRLRDAAAPPARYARGYGAMYLAHVTQADQGCDFDLLANSAGDRPRDLPYGLFHGWVGGW